MVTCTRYADKAIKATTEFVADDVSEIDLLPTTERSGIGEYEKYQKAEQGSTCVVGNQAGDTLTYMLFGFGWKQL